MRMKKLRIKLPDIRVDVDFDIGLKMESSGLPPRGHSEQCPIKVKDKRGQTLGRMPKHRKSALLAQAKTERGEEIATKITMTAHARSNSHLRRQIERSERRESARQSKNYFNKHYSQQGTVVVSYKDGERFSLGRLAKFSNEKVSQSVTAKQYSAALIGYISRVTATMEDAPEYETATSDVRLYTYDEKNEMAGLTNEQAGAIFQDDKIFTIILSPENPNVDLAEMVNQFVNESFISNMTGKPHFWVAANHYNTEHPHAHIMISRSDRNGNDDLRISRNYIKTQRAKRDLDNILTSLCGLRDQEQENYWVNRVANDRSILPVDNALFKMCKDIEDVGFALDPEKIKEISGHEGTLMYKRLRVLGKRNLVRYNQSRKLWVFGENFLNKLKINNYLALFDSLELDPNSIKRVVLDETDSPEYKGQIIAVTETNKESNRLLFMIKDTNGHLHLHENWAGNSTLVSGSMVSIERTKNGLLIKDTGRGGI